MTPNTYPGKATRDPDQTDRELAQQERDDAREQLEQHIDPALGPSDSSDSASDMPEGTPDTDSDRNLTGERAEVETIDDETDAADIGPDTTVPEEDAGLSHTRPDPARNGGIGG